ncbi:UDP-N-acetyl-D-mannosamine dehydrogenase [Sphingopyxis macrogoltabida]|uniref:UDP-N-acetyl-D-mannosaminuronic acid dehydrogenase n=1 Tax=Sphingopyxis macrogoltabida TaxID=33050 RepID=A0AAC9AXL1_SPHMC|nr:UDP-N-acetyl-D-mannosamine dehydrogenase [Sphingopyxis macrogoltabida]ALJ15663.1 UDP-N-acetyl-D-mannosaminuronic acid dehydrogenase [Sphingopyxis macrogoltabida]AMU91904.1 UDP-N-acetyl-D-mannosaminuronic acid dehydrogenase [Sphingopyxis macrogoltabida]
MPVDIEHKVTVVGLGYIGLPTAALIARSGCKVTGIDVSAHVVETVNSGRVHIEEVDLDGLVQGVVSRGALVASTETVAADTYVIAVPTPHDEAHRPDVTYVLDAARKITKVLEPGNLVILESTSPVGTTEKVAELLAAERPDLKIPGRCSGTPDIFLAYCPERVLPGRILVELVDNDRCIGGITPRCARRAMTFYRRFVRGACVTTTARAAEMVKLVENSYRDVNIAFANELSMIADKMGVDVWDVIRLANRHPRVNILQPGPGVGGHCIAVDPWFLVHGAPDESRLIRTAREVNLAKTSHVIAATSALIARFPDVRVGVLGLAFKPNIDDFRESPAVEIAAALVREFGARIQLVEPYAKTLPDELSGTGAKLVELDDALSECEILIVLVDHDVFKSVPLEERLDKTVYDTRGLWPDQPEGENLGRVHQLA